MMFMHAGGLGAFEPVPRWAGQIGKSQVSQSVSGQPVFGECFVVGAWARAYSSYIAHQGLALRNYVRFGGSSGGYRSQYHSPSALDKQGRRGSIARTRAIYPRHIGHCHRARRAGSALARCPPAITGPPGSSRAPVARERGNNVQ